MIDKLYHYWRKWYLNNKQNKTYAETVEWCMRNNISRRLKG